jgi:hypothetical protein
MPSKQAFGKSELEVQLELENCDLGEIQRRQLEEDLRRLRHLRGRFPFPGVRLQIQRHVHDHATLHTASCP